MFYQVSGTVRAIAFLTLLSVLCTCDPAPESFPPATVTATVRYQETSQMLEATLSLEPVDSTINAIYPTLFGTAMESMPLVGPGRYRTRRNLPFPVDIGFTVPCPDGPNCPLTYSFLPPTADSIPEQINKTKSLRFAVGTAGMEEGESLVVFFEPANRSTPRRLQLLGPTKSKYLTLRKEALTDIPAGAYEVYLVKQRLDKAKRPGLTPPTCYVTPFAACCTCP